MTTDDGYRLYVRIYRPVGEGRFAAVVFVPGGLGAGVMGPASLEARDLGVAEYGVVEVYFNAPGRGFSEYRSEGEVDYNGFKDQDALKSVVEYVKQLPYVDPDNVGVVSFSFGATMAAGFVGRYPDLVKFYVDAEGPSHSVIACCDYLGSRNRADTHDNLFGRYSAGYDPSPSNVEWWKQREAFRFIANFTGAYLRLQAEHDHIQPKGFYMHAKLLNNLAVTGRPWWVRINFENEVNKVYGVEESIPDLLPGKLGADKEAWKPYFRKAIIEMVKLSVDQQPPPIKGAQGRPLLSIHHYPYDGSLAPPEPAVFEVADVALEDGYVYYAASMGSTGLSVVAKASKHGNRVMVDWAYPYVLGAYAVDVKQGWVVVADSRGLKLLDPSGRAVWSKHGLKPVDVALHSPNEVLLAEDSEVRLITLAGDVKWRLQGLANVVDVDSLSSDSALVCTSNRVFIAHFNGTTVDLYEGEGVVDAELQGGVLYVLTHDGLFRLADGSPKLVADGFFTDVEVEEGWVVVAEGSNITAVQEPSWSFQC